LEQAVRQGLGLGGTVLMLAVDEPRHLALAARNHPDFKVVRALGANIVDVLHHETLVVSADALHQLGEVLSR
jgi:large subunit ribosomal protein L4